MLKQTTGINRLGCWAMISWGKMYARRIYPNVESICNNIRVLTLTNKKFGRFALGYLATKTLRVSSILCTVPS